MHCCFLSLVYWVAVARQKCCTSSPEELLLGNRHTLYIAPCQQWSCCYSMWQYDVNVPVCFCSNFTKQFDHSTIRCMKNERSVRTNPRNYIKIRRWQKRLVSTRNVSWPSDNRIQIVLDDCTIFRSIFPLPLHTVHESILQMVEWRSAMGQAVWNWLYTALTARKPWKCTSVLYQHNSLRGGLLLGKSYCSNYLSLIRGGVAR